MRKWIFLFCMTGFLIRGHGQLRQLPRLLHFTKSQYQAHYQNWSAAQAEDGIMFFGNTDGLLEFDGGAWSLHTFPEGQTVRSVAKGHDGRLYAGGYEEFGYWERDRLGRLQYKSLSRLLPQAALDQQEIWHILSTAGGIYFQSFGALFFYDFKKLQQVSIPGNLMFVQEVAGQLIAPVIGQGLYRRKEDGAWAFLSGSGIFSDKTVTGLIAYADGMLAATQEAGFFRYSDGQFSRWDHPAQQELSRYRINKVARLKDGSIAVGTILNGLYILHADRQKLTHLNRSTGLQNNTVLALHEDRQGNLWVGLDQGIDMLALSEPLSYVEDIQGKLGTVYAAHLHRGKLYVGSNQGLFCAPFEAGQITGSFSLIPGTEGQVWDLGLFDGQLLCGHNQGTFHIEEAKAELISPVTGGWKTILWGDRPGILLQGSYTGIVVFEKDAGGRWGYVRKVEGLAQPIKELEVDQAGYIWAVNPYEGAYRIQLDAQATRVVHTDTIDVQSGLPTGYNLKLLKTAEEVLVWSKDRYFRWEASSRRCTPARLSGPSMPAPVPGKVLLMANGESFWIFPGQLAWRSGEETKAWLEVSLVKQYEVIVALNDSLYLLCLENGFALLPRNLPMRLAATALKPMIKSISPLMHGHKKRSSWWSYDESTIRFAPHENHLLVQFALPSYTQPSGFRYRLKPVMQEWSAWSFQNQREFAELRPGLYVLEVQSNLTGGTAEIQFDIAPHWYQSRWMYGAYVLTALAFLYLLYRLHLFRLALQSRRLRIEKERQLHEQRLKAHAKQLQHDVLNKSRELANSTFTLIRKNETLQEVKDALQKMKRDLGERLPEQPFRQMLRMLDGHLTNEQDWEIFESNFTQVHEVFLKKLKTDFSDLTPGDLRLAAYLKMNLSSKEIAPLLNISIRGVENKRYRLRRKLHLDNDANLVEFLMQYG